MATQSGNDHLNGCMIALMPTAEDAKRLAISGGEAAGDLHVTLFFLGEQDQWDEDARNDLRYCMRLTMQWCDEGPVTSNVFGAAHWNPGGEKPAWVWSVGDAPGADAYPHDAMTLNDARMLAVCALEDMHRQPDLPAQHTPWVPHICAAYSDDLTLIKDLEAKVGPVTFDRIRVSFGSEDEDYQLTGQGMTAAGTEPGPRRRLTEAEVASRADFAMIDKQWRDAVGGMMSDYARVLADQRGELRDQITALVDSDRLADIDSLHVDTDACASLLRDHMLRYARQAGKEMQREAEHQGVQVPPWDLDSTVLASSAVDVITATARATARNLGLGVVQSAARKIMSLVGIKRSGRDVASKVDESIKTLSGTGPREQIGAAMSTAQNAGRVAVLSVAPAGQYLASEALDQNTCKPCRTIDGTEFESLAAAREAYPAGGYIDCQGGGRCRGTMIAVWGKGETASAAVERTDTVGTATETMGGKPSEGTSKDKRLKENKNAKAADGVIDFADCEGDDCPDEGMSADHQHFASQTLADVQAAWDGAASRYDDAQWKTATAACDTGDGTVKERCFLPHHDPGGALNMDGLAAAAGRANQAGSHSAQAVARAKAHLRSHYNKAGKPVPDNLKATAEERATFGVEIDYDMNVWGPPVDFADTAECPPNMQMDPATGECKAMPTSDSAAKTAAWEGVLVVEGETTGDGREFATDSLTWPDPITPGEVLLRWNKIDSHGGTPRTEAVAVGRIDKIWKDGNKIMGAGVFDLGNPDGVEAHRRVQEKFLRGVSIDADDVKNADVELVWPEPTGDEADDLMMMMFGQPDKMIYHGGRIRAATLCDIPAFIEAWIDLKNDEGAVVAGGKPDLAQAAKNQSAIVSERLAHRKANKQAAMALVAHGGPEWRPPAEWFENPSFTVPTTIHVSDEGRVYGHAAQWESCHIGFMDVCTKPPREEDFPYFLTGELVTAEGKAVSVGQITVTANHADLYSGAGPAKEHYENTGNAVADVAVGADRIGIWVAGAVRPGADPNLIHELRASGNVSGDWRKIGGQYRLVGLLGVNIGGFVVPKARVASGQVQALVAAGRLNVARPYARPVEMDRAMAYKIVMDDLYAQMFSPDAEGSE
jgi:hypothetical protein